MDRVRVPVKIKVLVRAAAGPEVVSRRVRALVETPDIPAAQPGAGRTLIKEQPDELKYYLPRSYIYELKGDVAHGLADCEKILELESGNPEAMGRKMRLQTRQTQGAPAPTYPPLSPRPSAPKKP